MVSRQKLAELVARALFEARVPPAGLRNRYVVTSDGKRFLMNTLVDERDPASFHVVLNWPTLLKR